MKQSANLCRTNRCGFILIIIVSLSLVSAAGCLTIPSTHNSVSDRNHESSPSAENQVVIHSTPIPSQTSDVNPLSDTSFPPDMPPHIREQLLQQGYFPAAIPDETENALMTSTPNPTPTSYVTRLADLSSENTFFPARSSIYFTTTASNELPARLRPAYTERGIPLNTTVKVLEVHVEKAPFSIRYSVYPKASPLVSWARITVLDSFQNVLYADGFNREFSSETTKEGVLYRNGTFLVKIEGEAGSLDISINTPDGSGSFPAFGTDNEVKISPDMPPQLREQLMSEEEL